MKLTPPQTSSEIQLSFPLEHAIQITFNRPKSLNAMTPAMNQDLETLLDWFENEDELWVAIITGSGRLFCAGADLIAWNAHQQAQSQAQSQPQPKSKAKASIGGSDSGSSTLSLLNDRHGFGSLSRRISRKPIIAAVNGGAYGGGMEILMNCDLVIAAEDALFAFPEVRRGVVALQGGIPRIAKIAGHQLASELLLTGAPISAQDAYSKYHFVNKIVPPSLVLQSTYDYASAIIKNSPDAVQATKHALLQTYKYGDIHVAYEEHIKSEESERVYRGDNILEGLRAFSEKRKPEWKNPAKL